MIQQPLKKINYNPIIANGFLESNDWVNLGSYLKDTFKVELDEHNIPVPFDYSEEVLDHLHNILKLLLPFSEIRQEKDEMLLYLFKALRNCACSKKAQQHMTSDEFLNTVKRIFTTIKYNRNDTVRYVIQFITNLVVMNEDASHKVFKTLKMLIYSCLIESINVIETSALLHNLSIYDEIKDFSVIETLLVLHPNANNVLYVQFLLENVIRTEYFWEIFEDLYTEYRVIALDLVKYLYDEDKEVPRKGFDLILKKFIQSADIIFKTSVSEENQPYEPYECALLLEIVASLSSRPEYLTLMREDTTILINSGVLLINIHRLGKSSENCFTPVCKLAQIRQTPDEIQKHPAFGFKANLVRLIGNYCYKNKKMQDLARTAELIPVLLDCCNIDARNPFIMQWVIFALRNLCEGNVENQKMIGKLEKQGDISSDTLKEFGFTLESNEKKDLKNASLSKSQKIKTAVLEQ